MKLFESYLAEAGLRAKEGKFDGIYDDIKQAFLKPTQRRFKQMKKAVERFRTGGEPVFPYDEDFEVIRGGRGLEIQIGHNDLGKREYEGNGAYYCFDYEKNDFSNTIEVNVDFTQMYTNFKKAKTAKELKPVPLAIEGMMSTIEHEMTHHLQYKLRKWLNPERNPFVNYSSEVTELPEEESENITIKYQIAYLVYFLFNDIEMEAQMSVTAHPKLLRTLKRHHNSPIDVILSYYTNIMQELKLYEVMNGEKFKWPQSKSLDEILDWFTDDVVEFTQSRKTKKDMQIDFEDEYITDSRITRQYVPEIMKAHYKPEYAYKNELKRAGIETGPGHKREIKKYVKEHPKSDKYWINLFIRECARRYDYFFKKFNKLSELYQKLADNI